jgi:hypothetical protein
MVVIMEGCAGYFCVKKKPLTTVGGFRLPDECEEIFILSES